MGGDVGVEGGLWKIFDGLDGLGEIVLMVTNRKEEQERREQGRW